VPFLSLAYANFSYAYQCEVSCTATYYPEVGWFTGQGTHCADAESDAKAQCRSADPLGSTIQGGCTESDSSAEYTIRCISYGRRENSGIGTVYGDDSAAVWQNARASCQSFCDGYTSYDGSTASCSQSASACQP